MKIKNSHTKVILVAINDRVVKNTTVVQLGSPLLQLQERRSIALWKDNERHLMSFPVNDDKGCFKKSYEEKLSIIKIKKTWKSLLPENYKPVVILRA